jgi:hypothetical protein
MTNNILQEMIELVLLEKIRSKAFKMSEFKSLETRRECKLYAERMGLQFLGEGHSRVAYVLSSSKVLKIALNSLGNEANKVEAEVYKKYPQFHEILVPILDNDQQYKWLISDLVYPAEEESDQKIINVLGADSYTFRDIAFYMQKNPNMSVSDILQKGNIVYQKYIQDLSKVEYYANLFVDLAKTAHVDIEDLCGNNLGVTVSGKLVALDYGLLK